MDPHRSKSASGYMCGKGAYSLVDLDRRVYFFRDTVFNSSEQLVHFLLEGKEGCHRNDSTCTDLFNLCLSTTLSTI